MAGHPRNIDSPEQLWNLFEAYKESIETIQIEVPHVKLGTVKMNVKAPITMEGFKVFAFREVGCIQRYIDGSLEHDKNQYVEIITRIKNEIYSHNFNRAAVGVYKENLIARQLGMTEKTENKNENNHTGKVEIIVKDTGFPLANNEKDIKLD